MLKPYRSWLFRAVARVTIASQVLASVPVMAAERGPQPLGSELAAIEPAPAEPAPTPEPVPAPPPAPPEVRVNRTVPEVEPPPAFPSFSQEPTDEEIHEARVFGEPLVAMGATDPGENKALAGALNAFLHRSNSDDFAPIERFLADHPNSPWRMSLSSQLGTSYRRAGYFTKALKTWEEAWKLGREATEPEARATAERALAELLELNMLLGRYEVIEAYAEQIEGRDIGGSAHEMIVRAREGAWILRNEHAKAVPSAAVALDQLMALGKKEHERHPRIAAFHGKLEGASLGEVHQLATEVGLELQMAHRDADVSVPIPSLVHLKVGHFSAVVKEEAGKYLLKDPILGDDVWMSREALNHETTGYFLIPSGRLPKNWRPASYAETHAVRGKCTPPVNVKTAPPAPPPGDDGPGGGGGSPPPDEDGGKKGCKGLASYSIVRLLVSLRIRDEPVGYTPPRGPAVAFRLVYNQREALQPATFTYSNLGPKWTFNWLSYLEDDPANPSASVSAYGRDGGQEVHTGYDATTQSYAPHLETRAVIVRTSSSPIRYERRLPGGAVQVFSQPDGASTYPRKVFLTEVRDAQGNAVILTYDASLRLVSITDAIGQVTSLAYENPDPLKITKVTDPFGRSARFDYNSAGQLERITDVIGLTSVFEYGASDFISALTTPYGMTTFVMAENLTSTNSYYRMIEATDPLGGKERLEYRWYEPTIPSTELASAVPTGFTASNSWLTYRNSFYWDKRAMALFPGDHTKAHITRFLLTPSGTFTSTTKHSEKQPLENRVFYAYPSQPDHENQGTIGSPIKIARVLDDGQSQIFRTEYNSKGHVTRETDPAGRETLYEYDTNEIDLLRIKQKNGSNYELVQTFTNNTQYLPLTVTDTAGQTTTNTYNAAGQILTVTTPPRAGITENRTTTYSYDPNGYLQSVTGPATGATTSYTYDGYGRVRTTTDPDGYTLTYDYDTLDRLTRTTYPDGTYDESVYNRLDPEKRRDRLGRWTLTLHDAVQRVAVTRDPLGRTTTQVWCTCGSLDKLIDPNGNATTWTREAQGRVIKETRADNSFWETTYETTTSRIKKTKDAKGQETHYAYYSDGRPQQVSYPTAQIATPSVSYTYDAYGRLATMTDGTGTTSYTYHPIGVLGAGQVATVDGPLANDTISYAYDELGRVVNRTLNGVTTSWSYDNLGRLTSLGDPVGSFTHTYDGTTGRVNTLTYPNGQTTSYAYLPNSGDKRLQEIHHRTSAGGTTLSKFNYAYDASGSITQWTQQYGTAPPNAYDLGYDAAEQLASAVYRTTGGSPTVLKRYGYGYDPAGNRTTEQIDDAPTQASFDNRNRLLSTQPGGALLFKGSVNEPATVTVGGKPATVGSTNQFEGAATVGSGTSNVVVAATDPAGNVRTNTYQVTISGSSKSFTYDANGSLTTEGTKTYEWDGANRLMRVLDGGAEIARFVYDGNGRRSQKIAGGVTRTYVYDGQNILEERLTAGATIRYIHGLIIDQHLAKAESGVVSYYLADHLGSVAQLTSAAGVVTLTRQYDAWGNLLQASSSDGYAFTGREWDPETGLYYYRSRYYSPANARFLSEDDTGPAFGINLYAYVENTPTRFIDPAGYYKVIPSVQMQGWWNDNGKTYIENPVVKPTCEGCKGKWCLTYEISVRIQSFYSNFCPAWSKRHEQRHIDQAIINIRSMADKYLAPREHKTYSSKEECEAAGTEGKRQFASAADDEFNKGQRRIDRYIPCVWQF